MEQAPGFADPNFPTHVCKLNKAIYGLRQAPRAWFHEFSSFLLQSGFVQSSADSSMFVHHSDLGILVLLLYVDDIILIGDNSSHPHKFIQQLSTAFAMSDLGDLHYFLGIEATKNHTGLLLTQKKYSLDLLHRIGMTGCKPCTTPVTVGSKLSFSAGESLPDPHKYRQIVGALQYLTITRPDLCYAVNQVCQFMHSPTTEHLLAVKRILRYLKHTLGAGIVIRPGPITHLQAYTDADWAGYPDTRWSTTSFCVFLGNTLVSWCSKKQPIVSRSSSEAEYKALAITTSEMLWLSYLLSDLKVSLKHPLLLHCDNISATHMAANPVLHARTKHIEMDYHFVRDLVLNNTLKVQFVHSPSQIADIFTKGSSSAVFNFHRSKLLWLPPISLQGDDKHSHATSQPSQHNISHTRMNHST
ncbi:uncharacterized mitochondrial protein AtMg00810-like [Telopea speciosissima]|uniref:uncharacterized mitochondrial protein AtMg00810-like n=1 Tax=Telopea speciosissima TaxID=54955 RepID=UPI001CC5171B|nr:uncharacterized mitochondrial protein AtMg00810-like [Telopea speciosissima]